MTTHAALLGCAHPHTGSHLETLLSLSEVAGIHLWDPEPEAATALAGRVGPKLVATHRELDDLLADERVGWVVACLRHDLSAAVLHRCAAAGKPVTSEKPIGLDYAETAAVAQDFRARGLSLSVFYVMRAKPAVQEARRHALAGHFGRICSAETRLHTTTVGLRNPQHWLFRKAQSGGGILPWLGCHHLDLFRYVIGAEAVSVSAHCATLSGEAIDVEDLATLSLEFDNGCLASASFGYLMPGGSAGNTFASKDTYFGLKGTLGGVAFAPTDDAPVVDLVSCHPAWVGAPVRRLTLAEEPAKAYGNRPGLEFARDCLTAALTGADGPATGEDMLATWAMIEGAYRSSATGQRVDLRR